MKYLIKIVILAPFSYNTNSYDHKTRGQKGEAQTIIMLINVVSGCSTQPTTRELNSNNLLVSTLIVHCFRYFVV